MVTQPERVPLTYDDYLLLPDDRNRYELLEGELAVTPAPTPIHQEAVLSLGETSYSRRRLSPTWPFRWPRCGRSRSGAEEEPVS